MAIKILVLFTFPHLETFNPPWQYPHPMRQIFVLFKLRGSKFIGQIVADHDTIKRITREYKIKNPMKYFYQMVTFRVSMRLSHNSLKM